MPLKPALSLFWRTFFLLVMLMSSCILAVVVAFLAFEFQPRVDAATQQFSSWINLSRSALAGADAQRRIDLQAQWLQVEAVRVMPRHSADRIQAASGDFFFRHLGDALRQRLGNSTVLAELVNDTPGLWVSFEIGAEPWWLQVHPARLRPMLPRSIVLWIVAAFAISLLGAALTARLVNRPMRNLSFAASRIRGGDLDSRLDETTLTSEIREVNKGFNRMARELAKVDEDRAVMLAGISHDLRTPLARMRLEAEMSVVDEEAKRNMAADIEQLDKIIDKFMDYARPGTAILKPVHLARLIDKEAAAFRDPTEIQIRSKVAIDIRVMADEVELSRVFGNLFENARRYGKSPESGIAMISLGYARSGPWVTVIVRDHGQGVAPEKLAQLTTPFYRGDVARTSAGGAGLGLAIVEKSLQRMGGSLELANAPDGGLMANIKLRRVA
jgi:two-component system osmolarity sensor histidine kinase EnvZ